jgi:hypothetical protein
VANPPPTPNAPGLYGGSDDSRGDTFLILDWGSVTGALSYDVQLYFGNPPQSAVAASVKPGDRISGLVANRAYAASLRAVSAAGDASPWSSPFMTATKPSQPLPPSAVRMPDAIAITVGWIVDVSQMDRPATLRVDVGRIYGPASMTPISVVGGPFPVGPQPIGLQDDLAAQFYAIRLIDDGTALPGGVVNKSYWSTATAPLRGQSGGLLRPELADPLTPALALRRSYGTRR